MINLSLQYLQKEEEEKNPESHSKNHEYKTVVVGDQEFE